MYVVNNQVYESLKTIRDSYGDGIFYNTSIVKNLLGDLAPGLNKERLLVINFLEMGGYFQLKHSGNNYFLTRQKLTEQYIEDFKVEKKIADWILDMFSFLLGYNPKNVIQESEPVKKAPVKKKVAKTIDIIKPPPAKKIILANKDIIKRISCDFHTAAVTKTGIVMAAGQNSEGQCNTNTFDWRDITAVSCVTGFTVGLRSNGTVTGVGNNDYRQLDFLGWNDITAISAGLRHTVGLRSDGSCLASGHSKNGETDIRHWRNITSVIAGMDCTFGIKKDGRVLVAGNNKNGDLEVSHLENVADIAMAGPGKVLALLKNGTIARVGSVNHMRKNFDKLKNIKQISAAPDYIAGLTNDGRVRLLVYFWRDSGAEAATYDWENIQAIAAGRYHIIGWQKKGGLIGTMLHHDFAKNKGQINITKWEM